MSASNCDLCGMEWKYHGTVCSSGGGAHSPAPPGSAATAKRNRYGYLLDDLRQPKCPHCGESTNKAYREHPNLTCWNCGQEMTPQPIPPDGSESRREFVRRFGQMTIHTGYGYEIEDYNLMLRDWWKVWEAARKWQRENPKVK